MPIVTATLKHLLRRKWKFPLAVFLFGVVLVALHHAFDVGGIREAAFEAMREPPVSRSPEQTAAITTWRRIGPPLAVLDAFLLVGPLLIGLLMPGGVVANERHSGAIMLWAQHPMPLSRFYMRRYLGIQIANLAALGLIALSVLISLTLPSDTVGVTDRFGESCIEGLLACAISFAVSALGIRRAAFFAFIYYVGSNMTMSAQLRDTLLGTSDVISFLIFPTRPIAEFTTGFESGSPWDWGATGILLYHFALWTAVSWLGLRRLERRPLKL